MLSPAGAITLAVLNARNSKANYKKTSNSNGHPEKNKAQTEVAN